MGVTGMLAGPPVIGSIAAAGSLAWGLGAVALSAVLVSVCATQIRWPVPNEGGGQRDQELAGPGEGPGSPQPVPVPLPGESLRT
jgi:hypothetical protein